jgi:hypothetical protein
MVSFTTQPPGQLDLSTSFWEFNEEKKGWHYGFISSRHDSSWHRFSVTFFEELPSHADAAAGGSSAEPGTHLRLAVHPCCYVGHVG